VPRGHREHALDAFESSGGVAVWETTMVIGSIQERFESFTTVRSGKRSMTVNPFKSFGLRCFDNF
jgi:hypothetical protein